MGSQRHTARHLAEAGAARVLAGPAATPDRLREEIMMLLDHPDRRQQLANTARQHGRPDAAAAVASAPIDAAGRYAS